MYVDHKEVGLRIKKLRNQNGVTQEQLAEQLNITTNFLYRIESGNRAASLDLLVEMTVHFGVTLDYLVLGNEQSRDSLKEKVRVLIQFLIKWLEEL